MGRAILIILIGSILLLSTIAFNTRSRTNQARESAVSYYSENQSRNICNSKVGMLMATFANDKNYRVNTAQTKSLFNGTTTYTMKAVLLPSMTDSVMEVNVTGIHFGDTSNVIVNFRSVGFVPPPVKGAIATNNSSLAQGNIKIDGRDHDRNGNLISNSGTYGIWTTQSHVQTGAAQIGGTDDARVDYVPSKPGNPAIIKTGQVWPGGYPDTPDKLMGGASKGFPEGTLKNIAMSGVNGSQYVTSPTSLTSPLSGVTYVEANLLHDTDISGSGILVVHNASTTALLRIPNGIFKGLIIADDIYKLHTSVILGAVVGLTPSPSAGHTIGNSEGFVLFSREVIKDVTDMILGIGYARQRLEVLHWYE